MHAQSIYCFHCSSSDLYKGGYGKNGTQCWQGKHCKKYVQLTYYCKARELGLEAQIDPLILNNSGVRDIARVLGINKNAVIAHLKTHTSIESILSKQ